MTHTDGPWEVLDKGDDEYSIDVGVGPFVGGEPHLFIATVHGGMSAGEHKANARLIAAAPELLAACKRLVASYLGGERGSYSLGELYEARMAAERAISKAEGTGQ